MISYPLIIPDGQDIYLANSEEELLYVLEPNDVLVSGVNLAYDIMGRLYRIIVQTRESHELLAVEQDESKEENIPQLREIMIRFLNDQKGQEERESLEEMTVLELMDLVRRYR